MSVTDQATTAVRRYLARHANTLTPVTDNLQFPPPALSGEIIFPLHLEIAGFNAISPHWRAGLAMLQGLAPLLAACDAAYNASPQSKYQECKDWKAALPFNAGARLGLFNTCFFMMKLTINVSHEAKLCRCGHASPCCVVTMFGNYTGGRLGMVNCPAVAKAGIFVWWMSWR